MSLTIYYFKDKFGKIIYTQISQKIKKTIFFIFLSLRSLAVITTPLALVIGLIIVSAITNPFQS